MKKRFLALLAVLVVLPGPAFAAAGGGIEYVTNVGSDLLPSLASGGGVGALPSGSVLAFSGFGYGVFSNGWKIGGFGLFFYANTVPPIPGLGSFRDALGWFGGVLSGGQARLGPLRLSLNLRFGAGMTFEDYMPTGALFGSVDGEVGFLFVPAMLVSAYAGVSAIAPVLFEGFIPIPTVMAGVRIAWGSF